MPSNCAVPICKNVGQKGEEPYFYRFPKTKVAETLDGEIQT